MRQYLVAAIFAVSALITASNANAQAATQDINLSATVAKSCLINLSATGAAINRTIPVDASGNVNTSVLSNSIANVTCNTAAAVGIQSVQGGVNTATSPPSGFSNIINYQAAATFGTATANLDTATTPTATGTETGTPANTTGAVSGSLSVNITPTANATPLVSGAYADVLRVTLTPL